MDQHPSESSNSLSLESEHDKLRKQADASDTQDEGSFSSEPSAEASSNEISQPEVSPRAPESEAQQSTDSPEPSAERLRGPDGKFLAREAAPTETPVTPPEVKPTSPPEDSKYKKSQQEMERRDRSWKALEAEKTELRALAEELRQYKHQLAQQPQNNAPKFDAAEYNRASGEFRDRANKLLVEGDVDGAREQFKLAEQCAAEARNVEAREQKSQQEHFNETWKAAAQAVIRDVPELGESGSPLSREMQTLLEQKPILGHYADGFKDGYEILKLRKEAAEASGLREESTKLKAEIERLNKLLAPAASPDVTRHSGPRNPGDMKLPELHAKLKRDAELADA